MVSWTRRIISINYGDSYFQFHRGIGGVITLGTATKDDIGELMSLHEALRLRYSRTVLCSCLIVLREGDQGGDTIDIKIVKQVFRGKIWEWWAPVQ